MHSLDHNLSVQVSSSITGGSDNLNLTIKALTKQYERKVVKARVDLATNTVAVVWDSAGSGSDLSVLDRAIIVNAHATTPFTVGIVIGTGVNARADAFDLAPGDFTVIKSKHFDSAFITGDVITFQPAGANADVTKLQIYPQGAVGAYSMYLFGN